jgi:hypothetical protein
LAEERATEIGFAVDVDADAGFDVLGEELGKDDLLGEEFGADGEAGLLRLAAGQKKEIKDGKEEEEVKESAAAHFCEMKKKEFNTEGTEDTEKRRKKRREKTEMRLGDFEAALEQP